MKKLRMGIIGCGGRSKAHTKGFVTMEDVEVVAVADPIRERAEEAARLFGCERIYKDHSELLDHAEDIDALCIFVDPTAHDEGMELRAIELGIPFLVEKPMTRDLALMERVAQAVEESGIITSVGFQDRYLSLVNMIKDDLPNHKPGGLVYGAWVGGIPGVWWWQKKEYCGGQLFEQNIHLLDGLRYLFGEPLSVYATSSRGMVTPGVGCSEEYDTDDHSTVVLRFENNVTATLVSGCYVKREVGVRPRCGLYISMEDVVYDYRLRNNLIINTYGKTVDIPRLDDQTLALDRAFVDAVLTGDRSLIRSDYLDACKSMRVAAAAGESMESGQVIYFDR